MDNKLVDLVDGKLEYNLGALNAERLDKYDKLAIVALIGNNFQFIENVESPEHNCIKVSRTVLPGTKGKIGMLMLSTDMTDQDNEISRSLCRLLYSMCTVMAIQFDKEIKVTDLNKYEAIISPCSRQTEEKPLLHLFVTDWPNLAGAKHGLKYWNETFPETSLNNYFSKIKCFLVPSVGKPTYERMIRDKVVEMSLFNDEIDETFVDKLCLDKVERLLKSLPTDVIKQIKSGPTPAPRVNTTEQVVDDCLIKINKQTIVQQDTMTVIRQTEQNPRTFGKSQEMKTPFGSAKESVEQIMRDVLNMKSVNRMTEPLSMLSLVDQQDNAFGSEASTSIQSTGSNEMTKINTGSDRVIKVVLNFKKQVEPIATPRSSCTSGIISDEANKPGSAEQIDVSQYHLANNIRDIIKNNFSAYLKLNNQTDVEKKLQDDFLAKFDINLNKAFVQDYSIIIVLLIEFKNIWKNKLKQEAFDNISLEKMLNSTSNRTKVDYKLVNYYNSLEQLIIAKIELINNENLENEAKLCQDALDYICDMSIEWLAKLNSSSSFNNNNINEFYDNFVSYSANSLRKNLKNNSVSENRIEQYCNKLKTSLFTRMNNN